MIFNDCFGRNEVVHAVGVLLLWEGDAPELNEVVGLYLHRCRMCEEVFDRVTNEWVHRDPQHVAQLIQDMKRIYQIPGRKQDANAMSKKHGVHVCAVSTFFFFCNSLR
jgi:hypothetical protein